MGVKMLTDKAGALQGVDTGSVARSAYGALALYKPDETGELWPGYAGAIVKPTDAVIQGSTVAQWDVLDYVVEVHEV